MIKKGFFILLVTVFMYTVVWAGESTNEANTFELYLSEKAKIENETIGVALFVSSEADIAGYHKGDIFLLFSQATVSGRVEGRIYSFFSHVEIKKGASVGDEVLLFSSSAYLAEGNTNVSPISIFPDEFALFFETFETDEGFIISNEIPDILIKVIFSLVRITICIILLSFRKWFFEQGMHVILKETLRCIEIGIVCYFMCVVLGVVFLFTVVGVPITFFMLAAIALLSLAGQVCGGMAVSVLCNKLILQNKNVTIYANILFGVIIMEAFFFIPYAGWFIHYVVLPVFGSGALCLTYINTFIYRKYYDMSFASEKQPQMDQSIRSMLLVDEQQRWVDNEE